MSVKSQHNNILLAIMGFVAVVIIVALIGFFTLGRDPEVMQLKFLNIACRVRFQDVFWKSG